MKIKIKGSLIELVKDVSLVQDPKIPYIVDFSFNEKPLYSKPARSALLLFSQMVDALFLLSA